MNTLGRTIQIYLPTGDPRGIRIAQMANRVVQAMAFPHHRLAEATARRELGSVAVYFLVGRRQGGEERPSVYIGEAEECAVRVRQHHADQGKGWWEVVVAVFSTSASFTKSHVRMLEFQSIERAEAAGRYTVENGNSGTRPHLTEPLQAEVAEVFETMELLLGTLGFPLFEPTPTSAVAPTSESMVFQYRGEGFDGRGRYVDGEFVVLKGSIARAKVTESARPWLPQRRESLEREGVIRKTDTGWVFSADHTFPSPSAAASMIYGGSANGWAYWKAPDGRTLSDVYRPETTDE